MTYFKEKTCFFQRTKTDFSQKSSKVQDWDRTQTATWIGTQAAGSLDRDTDMDRDTGRSLDRDTDMDRDTGRAWTETQTWTGTQAGPGQRHRHEQGHGQ